jgi:hypothetical protein
MANPVSSIEQKLQRTLEAGNFESALQLIDEYGKLIMESVRTAPTATDRLAILDEASSFVQDRLHLARVLRSHIASQITASSRLVSYGGTASVESTWQIDA